MFLYSRFISRRNLSSHDYTLSDMSDNDYDHDGNRQHGQGDDMEITTPVMALGLGELDPNIQAQILAKINEQVVQQV